MEKDMTGYDLQASGQFLALLCDLTALHPQRLVEIALETPYRQKSSLCKHRRPRAHELADS
jgi:hypothetical protein